MRIETIKRELFQFDELSDNAKEKARDWYREGLFNNMSHFDCVIDDAKIIGALMGIEIDEVFWSGFSSQGDGACFEGSYAYKKGSVKAVKDYAPLDKKLHEIVEALTSIQKKNGYKLKASVKQSGRYYHAYSTDINVSLDSYRDKSSEAQERLNGDQEVIEDILRGFMNWIYKQLDKQNDWLNSNESVDKSIKANKYEFLESGKLA